MIDIENIQKEIVERLEPVDAKKIILFGSYAYGTPNENSDLDLCIIKDNYSNKWDEISKIRKSLKSIRIPKDILLSTTEYFQTHSDDNWINTAYYDANKYGKVLYEKRSD
jgi:predicted nucleotidyltransferase